MQLSSKWMAYWLQQAKTNSICPSLVILPPSVTRSAPKWASPALLHLLSLRSALLPNPVHKYPHKLTGWLHLSTESRPLHPHAGAHAEETCPDSCPVSGILIAKRCHRAGSHAVPQGWLYFTILPSLSHYSFLPSPLLFFLTLPFVSFSVTVPIRLHSTNSRFIRDTLSPPSALPSWSLILLKLFKLSVKCYATTFCPQRQGLTEVWITGGWYLAANSSVEVLLLLSDTHLCSVHWSPWSSLFRSVMEYLSAEERKKALICKAKASNFPVRVGRSAAVSKHSPTEISDAVSNNCDKKLN